MDNKKALEIQIDELLPEDSLGDKPSFEISQTFKNDRGLILGIDASDMNGDETYYTASVLGVEVINLVSYQNDELSRDIAAAQLAQLAGMNQLLISSK